MISDDDIARMTDACRQLAEPVGDYFIDDYLSNLVATVIDFQTHTDAVERALSISPPMSDRPSAGSTTSLS